MADKEKTHKIRLGSHGWQYRRRGLGINIEFPKRTDVDEERPVIEVSDEVYQDIAAVRQRGLDKIASGAIGAQPTFDFEDVPDDTPVSQIEIGRDAAKQPITVPASLVQIAKTAREALQSKGVATTRPIVKGGFAKMLQQAEQEVAEAFGDTEAEGTDTNEGGI